MESGHFSCLLLCAKMFPPKLVRSLIFGGETSNNNLLLSQNHHFFPKVNLDYDGDGDNTNSTIIATQSRNRIPLLLFVPTQELVEDTYRLSKIARAIGMDLNFNPSISHVIFSWPSPLPSPSPSSSSSSSSRSSHSWSLPDGSVPLPFPSFSTASLSHLRLFVNLAKGCFKLGFLKNNYDPSEKTESLRNNNLHCTPLSLISTRTGEKVRSMDGFSKALLGMGWTLFKTCNNDLALSSSSNREFYLYRKMELKNTFCTKQKQDVKGDPGESCRVRELRLPAMNFNNAPLRILQYILLMTDDIFYLA